MDSNPYRASAEDVLLYEPDWRKKYEEAAAARDFWQGEAYGLEEQVAALKRKAKGAIGNTCIFPSCTSLSTRRSGVGLCGPHMVMSWNDTQDAWKNGFGRSDVDFAIPTPPPPPPTAPAPWVVYYIQIQDRIKIGRTTDLATRMRSFYAMPEQLLAVEPGVVVDGVDRERQRHMEYAEWRLPNTELFERSPKLDAHIANMVATFGDPRQYL